MKTVEDIFEVLKEKGNPLSTFTKGTVIKVNDKMQKGYEYRLEENPGENFDPEFTPHVTPGEMLALGVFGGKYLNDCCLEFPAEWFWHAGLLGKLSPGQQDVTLNYFKTDSRLSLQTWQENGWIPAPDKTKAKKKGYKDILSDPSQNPDGRGWFQWYCRYWMGRRLPELDKVQIGRWKAFKRHRGAVEKGCKKGDMECRKRQRQALLQWAWRFD